MHFLFKIVLLIASAIGLSFTQAPYGLWFLIFPCFGLFYFLYQGLENKRKIFLFSFLFALGYFVTGLNWIGNALLVEGNEYKWVWPLAVIALPTLLSLFTALFLTANYILFKGHSLSKFIGFCVFLSFSEWVRGYAFTGFPWNLYGYGVTANIEISQSLSVIGPYGLTFLTILWGSSTGHFMEKRSAKIFIILIVVLTFGGTHYFGQERLKTAQIETYESFEFHIIQPNIAQANKWKNEALANNFNKLVSALQTPLDKDKRHIVIWPETAIPPVLLNSPAAKERIKNMLGDNAILLAGALIVEGRQTPSYYNALTLWSQSKSNEKLYSKTHLVPFGEYIPFQKHVPLKTITQFSGFERGNGSQTISIGSYPSFAPLICYEIIFPHQVINKKSDRPDYILTITNDGWYGDSVGPHQHFSQARFRAIEQGIPVIRSANTGISGIIDPYGRVIQKLDLLEYGAIESSLPVKIATPTLYSRYGDIPFLGSLLFLFLVGLFLNRGSSYD